MDDLNLGGMHALTDWISDRQAETPERVRVVVHGPCDPWIVYGAIADAIYGSSGGDRQVAVSSTCGFDEISGRNLTVYFIDVEVD